MTSSSPHIGIVSTDAPPFIGGMGRSVGALADGLRSQGFSIDIFDRSHRPFAWRLLKNIGFSIGLNGLLRHWVKEKGISMLHVHAGPGGVFLPDPPDIPVIVTAHHTYAQQSKIPGQGWKHIFISSERATYQHAERVICASPDTAASLESDYGISRAKISLIPWGFEQAAWIAADQPDEKRNQRQCVFVGRPDKRKGWDLMLGAWEKVNRRFSDTILHVVGKIPRSKIQIPGLVFHGHLQDSELQSLSGGSRFLICPSRLEGFGLTAAEAIVAGTPVVGTGVDGLRSVVQHDRTGILVAPDVQSIADAMIRLFSDDALWKKLREGCRGARATFDPAPSLRAHTDLFREVYSHPI